MTLEVIGARMRRWQALTGGSAVFQRDGFRQLWMARLLANSGVNAMVYTLLVLAVGSGSGASIKSALFITAYLLPTATLGTVSGVMVDRLPKNLVLAGVNVGRVGLMIILLMSNVDLWTIYGIALLLAMTSQFSTPAEAAALPQLVPAEQLTSANSVNTLGGLVSQVVGLAVLPPLFLNTIGARPLFFVCLLLFGGAAAVFLSIRHLGARGIDLDSTFDSVREVRKQFAEAWEQLSRDLGAYMSVVVWVLSSTTALIAATLMARFTESELDVPVRNAIFLFLPAAIGVVAGLRLVQWIERRVPKASLVGGGYALMMASLLLVALVRPLGAALEGLVPALDGAAARIAVTIVFSATAAFFYSVVGVASRALVNERLPLGIQGRIFAAQTVLTNLASIPPILLAGLLAALFGAAPVLVLTVVLLSGVAGWSAARAAARVAPSEAT